jgi:hypothetical protein
MSFAPRSDLRNDDEAVGGFQESLVAALVITVAAGILLAGIGSILMQREEGLGQKGKESAAIRVVERLQESDLFNLEGQLEMSSLPHMRNMSMDLDGGVQGIQVVLSRLLDEGPAIEVAFWGELPLEVLDVQVIKLPVSVRISADQRTAGLLTVLVW